jgi:WD40 repeat protein
MAWEVEAEDAVTRVRTFDILNNTTQEVMQAPGHAKLLRLCPNGTSAVFLHDGDTTTIGLFSRAGGSTGQRVLPPGVYHDMAFSAGGKWLVAASSHPRRLVVLAPDDEDFCELVTLSRPASALAFSSDERILAVGVGNSVSFLDLDHNGELRAQVEIPSGVKSMAFAPVGDRVRVVNGASQVHEILFSDLEPPYLGRAGT